MRPGQHETKANIRRVRTNALDQAVCALSINERNNDGNAVIAVSAAAQIALILVGVCGFERLTGRLTINLSAIRLLMHANTQYSLPLHRFIR